MIASKLTRICVIPRLNGVGGMVSFQRRLAAGLAARGIEICYDLGDKPYEAVLVVGGTRQLGGLWRVRKQGIPVVQRLDGMNWVHRVRLTSLRHFLRAEYGNAILGFIRARLASGIVYQSEFSRRWWERVRGLTLVPNKVIYNGVDLNIYTPDGACQRPEDYYRLLLVEGSLMGGYEMGLEVAVKLAENMAGHLQLPIALMVVGRVPPGLRRRWEKRAGVPIQWAGLVPQERIREIDCSAHLLYSADVNAACPNSVVEALACGLPVVSFDTGALAELVGSNAGRIVAYGGDPWRLDPPDTPVLAEAAVEVLQDQAFFRSAARARAESMLGLDRMVDGYMHALTNYKG